MPAAGHLLVLQQCQAARMLLQITRGSCSMMVGKMHTRQHILLSMGG
jgi:hypothetical protein